MLIYDRRASAVYRISRFPAPRSEKQRYAWQEGKKACIKGLGCATSYFVSKDTANFVS